MIFVVYGIVILSVILMYLHLTYTIIQLTRCRKHISLICLVLTSKTVLSRPIYVHLTGVHVPRVSVCVSTVSWWILR